MVLAEAVAPEEAKRIDAVCHAHKPSIAFVKAECRGVFARIFTDFGSHFTVFDVDGAWGDEGHEMHAMH